MRGPVPAPPGPGMNALNQVRELVRKPLGVVRLRIGLGLRRLRALRAGAAAEPGDDGGFEALLAEVGGTPPAAEEPSEAQLRIARATIEELREKLQQLQPLGDLLAEAEQARLDLLDELEGLREDVPAPRTDSELEKELQRARRAIEKRDRRVERLTERLERLRARHAERDRVATERWRELVALRRENRELARDSGR